MVISTAKITLQILLSRPCKRDSKNKHQKTGWLTFFLISLQKLSVVPTRE